MKKHFIPAKTFQSDEMQSVYVGGMYYNTPLNPQTHWDDKLLKLLPEWEKEGLVEMLDSRTGGVGGVGQVIKK